MSTHFEHYLSGNVFGVKYRFDDVGDGLPFHAHHDMMEEHNIVVTRGIVFFRTDSEPAITLVAGNVLDFDCAKYHEVVALEPNSQIINFFLRGIPPDYVNLAPSDLSGTFDRPKQ